MSDKTLHVISDLNKKGNILLQYLLIFRLKREDCPREQHLWKLGWTPATHDNINLQGTTRAILTLDHSVAHEPLPLLFPEHTT